MKTRRFLLFSGMCAITAVFSFQIQSQVYQGKPFTNDRFTTSPQVIPGKVMCACYDSGGEDVAYHETTEANMGSGRYNPADGSYLNEFRMNEGVDISYTKQEMDYTDRNKVNPELGMLYVGWTDPGEWINYTVDVKVTATYHIRLLFSAQDNGKISLSVDGKDMTGLLALPSTTSPHVWDQLDLPTGISLEKGVHIVTLHTRETGGMNYAYMEFIPAE